MIGTSIYVHSYMVCFHVFLKYRCLLYQLRYVFVRQIFITKNNSYYCKQMIKGKVGPLRKLSKFYTIEVLVLCTEAVNSYYNDPLFTKWRK
jgi:hypothetical protein